MSTIGEQIKELRNKHHLTQSELGEQLHISRSTIANWESNQNYPDIQTIIELSNLFDISLDQLLKGDQQVVEKIADDTKIRKNQTKKIIVLYVLATMLLSVILLFLLPRIINKDITDDSMIASAKIENNILIVGDRFTLLPFV